MVLSDDSVIALISSFVMTAYSRPILRLRSSPGRGLLRFNHPILAVVAFTLLLSSTGLHYYALGSRPQKPLVKSAEDREQAWLSQAAARLDEVRAASVLFSATPSAKSKTEEPATIQTISQPDTPSIHFGGYGSLSTGRDMQATLMALNYGI